MIETSYKIVRYHTDLPYNCVFCLTGSEDEKPKLIRPQNYIQIFISQLQGFPFHYRKIQSEDLNVEVLREKAGLESGSGIISSEEVVRTLQEIFPSSPHGCFVVRLLPIMNDSDDGDVDTFLVGHRVEAHFGDLSKFAHEAAIVNFERMTGMSYEAYKATLEEEEEEEEGGPVFGMLTYQTSSQRNERYSDHLVRTQNQIIKMYQKKFVELANEPKPTFDQFKDLVSAAFGDVQNVTKMHKECPVRVDYDEEHQEYEVMLCPKDDEPIICDFGRSFQSKALYIFFLRHPEGIRLKDLMSEQYVKELAAVYTKFKGCSDEEGYKKAKGAIKGRSIYINDIKSFFEEMFVPAVAGKYCIAKMGEGRYGIALDEVFIELESPFDKRVIE